MAEATLNIVQGEDWEQYLSFRYSDGTYLDLTQYNNATMQIRDVPQNNRAVATVTVQIITTSTPNQIKLSLARGQTANIPAFGATTSIMTDYVSDLYLTNIAGERIKICNLPIKVEPEVTRI